MKRSQIIPGLLLLVALALSARGQAAPEESFFDRLTVSARFGLNVKAKFGPRLTPSGGAYNYLDGYVLPDSTGGFDPTGTYPSITHNWGYDDSTRQNDTGNKEILMTTMAGGDPSARSLGDDVQPGFEIGYQHEIGTHGKWRYGVEGAFNFMNLCLSEAYAYNGAGLQYNFPYTFNGVSGNNPPATYQGTYDFNFGGPNFEISANPTAGSPTPVTLAAAGQNKFSADIWGFRLGPYVEYPLGGRGKVILTGGFAFALIDSRASWSQSLSVNSGAPTAYSGSGSKTGVAYGYYLGANLAYKVSKRWSAIAGVQWQDLSTFDYVVGSQPASRRVQLDMSGSIYLLLGLSYSF